MSDAHKLILLNRWKLHLLFNTSKFLKIVVLQCFCPTYTDLSPLILHFCRYKYFGRKQLRQKKQNKNKQINLNKKKLTLINDSLFFFCARNISKGEQLELPLHNWVTSLRRFREPEYPKWRPKLSIRWFLNVFKRSLSAGFDWNYLLDIAHHCKLFHWAILIQF